MPHILPRTIISKQDARDIHSLGLSVDSLPRTILPAQLRCTIIAMLKFDFAFVESILGGHLLSAHLPLAPYSQQATCYQSFSITPSQHQKEFLSHSPENAPANGHSVFVLGLPIISTVKDSSRTATLRYGALHASVISLEVPSESSSSTVRMVSQSGFPVWDLVTKWSCRLTIFLGLQPIRGCPQS